MKTPSSTANGQGEDLATTQPSLNQPIRPSKEHLAAAKRVQEWLKQLRELTAGDPVATSALLRLGAEPSRGNRAARRKDTKECNEARKVLLRFLQKHGRADLIQPPPL